MPEAKFQIKRKCEVCGNTLGQGEIPVFSQIS